MKNNYLRIGLFVLFAVLACFEVYASNDYLYISLESKVNISGAGKIYIDGEERTGTYQVGGKGGETYGGKSHEFKLGVEMEYGYSFQNWDYVPSKNGGGTLSQDKTVANNIYTVNFSTYDNRNRATGYDESSYSGINPVYTNKSSITANFIPENIVFRTQEKSDDVVTVTWKNRYGVSEINFTVDYASSIIGYDVKYNENYNEEYGIENIIASIDHELPYNEGEQKNVTTKIEYEILTDEKFESTEDRDNYYAELINLDIEGEVRINSEKFPDADNFKEPCSSDYIGFNIGVDLTPTFALSTDKIDFGEVVPLLKSLPQTLEPSEESCSFPHPHRCLKYSYKIPAEYENIFNIDFNEATGECTITFIPAEDKNYETELEIIATWTDAKGVEKSYSNKCTLFGVGSAATEGELIVTYNGVETEYEVFTNINVSGTPTNIGIQTFYISTVGINITEITGYGSNEILVKVDPNNTYFTIEAAPAIAGSYKKEISIMGIDIFKLLQSGLSIDDLNNIDFSNMEEFEQFEDIFVNKVITIEVQCRYSPITITAFSTLASVSINWPNSPFATSYILTRTGGVGNPSWTLEPGQNTYSVTDTNIEQKREYTYTLSIIVDEQTYTTDVIVRTPAGNPPKGIGYLTYDNADDLSSFIGNNIDLKHAFNEIIGSEDYKNTLVDDVYILNNTLCYVYTRSGDKQYAFINQFDPKKNPVGKIENRNIYICGTCEQLAWNYGDFLGWMQLNNCNVYIDNVRLQTSENRTSVDAFKETVVINGSAQTFNYSVPINKSASVFFLISGNNSIHIRGNNYLGGNLSEIGHYSITADVNVLGQAASRTVENFRPIYAAPISIKDASLFTGDPSNITCTIDAIWADGNTTNGYLDLAVRPCASTDKIGKNNWETGIPKSKQDPTIYSNQDTHFEGYRYEPPLSTGGNHGTFIINGGIINLWPSNGLTTDVGYANSVGSSKLGGSFAQRLVVQSGHSTTYLMCGTSKWILTMNPEAFNGSQDQVPNFVKNVNGAIIVYGTGDGLPLGNLIINGGTISAKTDTKSFGYRAGATPNAEDTGQPLFAPNVVIRGGTFQHPIYGTTEADHNIGKCKIGDDPASYTWKDGINNFSESDYRTTNNTESVYRVEQQMPEEMKTDYTNFNKTIAELDAEPLIENGHVLCNPGKDNEYQYGMMNVWSDESGKCWFYLPAGDNNYRIEQNYYVKTQDVRQDFDFSPYNLTIDNGGQITKEEDFQVYGYLDFRSHFKDDVYEAITLPFDVNEFFVTDEEDPHYRFYSYVDENNDHLGQTTEDAKNKAYCYIYYLDNNNGNGEQQVEGINEKFSAGYYTHADGSTMKKGKTYVIKFPWAGDNYWANNYVTFRGQKRQKGQTINGTNQFKLVDRPTVENVFIMDGNATFAKQSLSPASELYIIDQKYGDNNFHATTIQSLEPMQGYVVAKAETMSKYRIIDHRDSSSGGTTTGLQTITNSDPTLWQAFGGENKIMVNAQESGMLKIYNTTGQLIGSYDVVANMPLYIEDLSAGIYVLRLNEDTKKLVVW